MTVVGTLSGGRTFLQSVAKIIGEVGEQRPVTLLSPTLRIQNAMDAVENARDEVFYKAMWEFRRGFFSVDPVASTMWYELPEDHHKLASFISRNSKDEKIWYRTYDDMLAAYPDMRLFPPGSTVNSSAAAAQSAAQTTNFGAPLICTTAQGYLGFMPIPDADFVASEPRLYAHYWRDAPMLVADSDDLGLPRSLWDCHHLLALSRLKKVLEYSDWDSDRLVGARMLSERSSSKGEPTDMNIEHRNVANYNE